MKKKTKKRKKNRKLSMSKMLINFAQDFISLGNTIEVRQSYLNAACVAWNISILNKDLRPQAIDNFIEQYKKSNPNVHDSDNVRKDIETLIEEKLEMYPNEKMSILDAKIVDDKKGKEKIIIFSKQL